MSDIKRNLEKIGKIIEEKAVEGVIEGLYRVAEESVEECPVDTGELRESMEGTVNEQTVLRGKRDGTIEKIGSKVNAINGEIGGIISYDTDYAVYQHENLTLNHPTPGTKAKYLENPLKRNEQIIINIIAKKIREGLR
ncbi:hypothetical protein [Tepidimicrobium xylanilyticum]